MNENESKLLKRFALITAKGTVNRIAADSYITIAKVFALTYSVFVIGRMAENCFCPYSVSYTHLTLPTICSV